MIASVRHINCSGEKGENMESNSRFGNSPGERGRWAGLGCGSGIAGEKGLDSGGFESRTC